MSNSQAMIDRYFDGELTTVEAAEFETWLATDASHQRQVAAQAMEHLMLRDALSEHDFALPPSVAADESQMVSPTSRWWHPVRDRLHTVTSVSLILAGLFVTTMLLLLALWTVPAWQPAPADSAHPDFVARLVRTHEAEWLAATAVDPVKVTDLHEGQLLELEAGWAEVQFDDGARIVLTAPARLRIIGTDCCDLLQGELVARADKAPGFTVETMAAQIIDLGTEFGVAVRGNVVETAVFEGEVVVRENPDARHRLKAHQLSAGEALTITVGNQGLAVESKASKLRNFVVATRLGSGEDLATELPVDRGLAVWYSADSGVRRDASGGVVAWHDRLTSSNESAEPAEQAMARKRPQWIAKGINGRPVVRFNGKTTSLTTLPIDLGNEVTIFAVLQANTIPKVVQGAQVANIGGYVLEILPGSELQGRAFNGTDNSGEVSATIENTQPVIVAYRFQGMTEQGADLSINGRSVAPANTLQMDRINRVASIGSHPSAVAFLDGDIAELIVFDCILTNIELRDVAQFLTAKYLPN